MLGLTLAAEERRTPQSWWGLRSAWVNTVSGLAATAAGAGDCEPASRSGRWVRLDEGEQHDRRFAGDQGVRGTGCQVQPVPRPCVELLAVGGEAQPSGEYLLVLSLIL